MLWGINKFENVIDKNGGWKRTPRILRNTAHCYTALNEDEVFKTLISSGLIELDRCHFKSPKKYIKSLRTFILDEGRWASVNYSFKTQIVFCEECIKQDLIHLGFSYFRYHWTVTGKCLTHGQSLLRVPQSNASNGLASATKILRGFTPKECREMSTCSVSDSIEPPEMLHYYAPCFVEEFVLFILFAKHRIPADTLKLFSVSRNRMKNCTKNFLRPYMVKNIERAFRISNFKEHTDFLKIKTELRRIPIGVLKPESVCYPVYKSIQRPCGQCPHTDCVANATGISIFKLNI